MPTYLTYDQVAERLHTTRETVRYWVTAGKLPAYKLGKHPLIKEADLAAAIEASSLSMVRARRVRAARTVRP